MERNPALFKRLILASAGIFLYTTIYSQSVYPEGSTITTRFSPPPGYERVSYSDSSFQNFLRLFPLKPHGSPVYLYNGTIKNNNVHAAVFNMPLLEQDLIQCADAVMKLRAEYLYRNKRFDEISFTITNGMDVPFITYTEGFRMIASGNNAVWKAGYGKGTSRDIFDQYLKFIYSYAGTYSLAKESKKKSIAQIEVGDYFIVGGSPGHVVLVVDLAVSKRTGKKVMLLGQSYMPSQEFHVLKSSSNIYPWYYVEDDRLVTPEWVFDRNNLMGFR